MSGLGKRLGTSLVLIPILVALVGWAPWQGFALLATIALGVGFHEFYGIVLTEEPPAVRRMALVWGMIAFLGLLFSWNPLPYGQKWMGFPHAPSGLPVFVLLLFGVAISFLVMRGKAEDLSPLPSRIGLTFLGAVYIGLLGSHVVWLTRLPDTTQFQVTHAGWLFLLMMCTFGGDTGAYFFGKSIGGPKLFPSVSPNKTWAGLLGCIVGASLGAWIVHYILLSMLAWQDCVILGIGCALLGQTGDFFESLLKRAYNVKDSGTILPGHGGILDRIDALLFNGPFVFYYATWVVLVR